MSSEKALLQNGDTVEFITGTEGAYDGGAAYFACRQCRKSYWFYSQFCCGVAVEPIRVITKGPQIVARYSGEIR